MCQSTGFEYLAHLIVHNEYSSFQVPELESHLCSGARFVCNMAYNFITLFINVFGRDLYSPSRYADDDIIKFYFIIQLTTMQPTQLNDQSVSDLTSALRNNHFHLHISISSFMRISNYLIWKLLANVCTKLACCIVSGTEFYHQT